MNEYPKVVPKKWGQEIWYFLNDKYCFKQIYLNAGYFTSLQYHEKKHETITIANGHAIFYYMLEGAIASKEVGPGFSITLEPLTIHRFKALTDLTMYECSTPEVDDVVRLEDGGKA